MKVLLSIKPQYAQKIFTGEKRYEYRRNLFKREDIDTIVVYVTKPVGKVIGEFEIDSILKGAPNLIWEETKLYAGIDENAYLEYFSERETGFAIAIKKTKVYKEPLELVELNPKIKCPPQSFMYL
ncbi:hypothetical protein CPJCM30710_25040 [Clostridium polyendosporum]|uniref:ASCH domain-containing protein n=1 Tax=Clostridium polyendosporum TaxID=69208 RepID=A0A919VMR2_9CLOT|nr:ASCH domain-containing protein [Clostridium polyendosporum]GIM29838.1 hypothetical protein CPJCM30710_25040 [Clostridium polyendosporum]